MNLCSRCHKNPAVVYITKMEGDKTTNEGLCIACAKELGIAPINSMIEQMGITDEDIENMNSEMAGIMSSLENDPEALQNFIGGMLGDENEEGGAPTAPLDFLSGFMPGGKNEESANAKDTKEKDKKNPIFSCVLLGFRALRKSLKLPFATGKGRGERQGKEK